MPIPKNLLAEERFLKDVKSKKLSAMQLSEKYFCLILPKEVGQLRVAIRSNGVGVQAEKPTQAAESHERSGDNWQISLPRTRIKTLEGLMEACEVDTEIWEVERFVCNKWEVGARDSEGNIQTEPLFQVKAWLKRRRQVENVRAVVDAMIARADKYAPRYERIKRPKIKDGVLLEISPFDLHLGKLCWGDEVGADYDLNIARSMWETSVRGLADSAGPYDVEKVVLVIGQDFFNVDNARNETTNGTRQDEDTRWQKSFMAAEAMVVEAVDDLRLTAPVEIKVVPGNHDSERAFYLGRMMASWYRRCPDVEVDCGPGTRKIVHYGRNLIMFTHGNNEKHATLPLLMAQEYPMEWSQSHFREVHTGHFHQKRETRYTEEFNAVRVRILPSLAPADAWHSGKGYKSLPAAEAFVWHPEDGLIAQLSHTPRIPKEKQ